MGWILSLSALVGRGQSAVAPIFWLPAFDQAQPLAGHPIVRVELEGFAVRLLGFLELLQLKISVTQQDPGLGAATRTRAILGPIHRLFVVLLLEGDLGQPSRRGALG